MRCLPCFQYFCHGSVDVHSGWQRLRFCRVSTWHILDPGIKVIVLKVTPRDSHTNLENVSHLPGLTKRFVSFHMSAFAIYVLANSVQTWWC